MKCFNHPQKDAVGLCKICFKGLCDECVSADETGSCNDHVNQARKLNQFFSINSNLHEKLGFFSAILGLIFLVCGMVLIIAGFTFRTALSIYVLIPIGLIFMVSSLLLYKTNKRFLSE